MILGLVLMKHCAATSALQRMQAEVEERGHWSCNECNMKCSLHPNDIPDYESKGYTDTKLLCKACLSKWKKAQKKTEKEEKRKAKQKRKALLKERKDKQKRVGKEGKRLDKLGVLQLESSGRLEQFGRPSDGPFVYGRRRR